MTILAEQAHFKKTLMYREAKQAPDRVRQQLSSNAEIIQKLATHLRKSPPTLVVTCARGSSDHAACYAKYLIETRLCIPTMSTAPSVNSIFGVQQKWSNTLFLPISQSGQSPDILASTKAAKQAGAFVVAIVNDESSPLAAMSDMVLPMRAGVENSIAATKSFICTLTALVDLVAAWQGDADLKTALENLPDILRDAFSQDWTGALDILRPATNLYTISRGLGLACARESALKLKEICGLHAEAFSAAEVKHGPMAIVQNGFPVLVLSLLDQTQDSIDMVALAFEKRAAKIMSVGKSYEGAVNLNVPICTTPELRPIIFIQAFYKFAHRLSFERGYNPETPPYLNKVTETL